MIRSMAKKKIHRASHGDHAPDDAVRERRVEVVLVDEAGAGHSYGWLVERRTVGQYLVELTDDTERGLWWVVVVRTSPPGDSAVFGFRRGRQADAKSMFDDVTEADLDRGTTN